MLKTPFHKQREDDLYMWFDERTVKRFHLTFTRTRIIMRQFRFVLFFFPIVLFSLAALAAMGLWNWLMPTLFGLTIITILQALGLMLLAKLLFGSVGGRLFGRFGARARMMCPPAGMGYGCGSHGASGEQWKAYLQERWQKSTPEQKEECAKRRGRCFGKEVPSEKTSDPTK